MKRYKKENYDKYMRNVTKIFVKLKGFPDRGNIFDNRFLKKTVKLRCKSKL